jgi:hypothetical protein
MQQNRGHAPTNESGPVLRLCVVDTRQRVPKARETCRGGVLGHASPEKQK